MPLSRFICCDAIPRKIKLATERITIEVMMRRKRSFFAGRYCDEPGGRMLQMNKPSKQNGHDR